LRLSSELAESRLHPAVDLVQSGTRHEVELVGQQRHAALTALRTRLAGKGAEDGLRELLDRIGSTHSNAELLGSGR
jgi:transcription termination factor Rho